jgi:phage shock protein PspC (stress-responsive transcriptional regulator)
VKKELIYTMNKRLYRSRTSRIIGGVCGGFAEYFEVDPTLVRILTILLFLLPGIGILTYIIAWIIIPERPFGEEPVKSDREISPWNKYLFGLILVAVGVVLLLEELWYWFEWEMIFPFVLIVVGIAIIVSRLQKRDDSDHGEVNGQHVNINGER